MHNSTSKQSLIIETERHCACRYFLW